MRSTTLLTSVLLSSAAALPAQVWAEAGDAGQVPASAQVPTGTGNLAILSGTLTDAADAYLIQIDNPAAFSATTINGATFDTQLFLFDQEGRGVVYNDDLGVLQSTINGQLVPAPGRYYLAISHFDIDPLAAGNRIWNPNGLGIALAPDGPRRHEVVDGWDVAPAFNLPYSIFLTGASFAANRLVLPDNHHLSENADQAGASGTTGYWRNGGGRFQLLYEGSHFTNAGVSGPIAINRIMFRGEDGEANLGGTQWQGATVRFAATNLTAATMSTTFAANLAAGATVLGPSLTGAVTMRASRGSTPNNENILIDLSTVALSFQFDPTGALPNLLVDVQLPSAAQLPAGAIGMMPMQDTSGDPVTFVRGRGVTSPNVAAATGVLEQPLAMAVEFGGAGGKKVVVPARNEQFGAACGGSPSSFYQSFVNGQAFDLVGLRLVPDNSALPTWYTVSGINTSVDVTKIAPVPDSIADDGVVVHPLGFQFRTPQFVTSSIAVCTNGFLWLNPATVDPDFTPSVGELLGGASPRLAPFWCDLDCGRNVAVDGNAGLHVLTDTSGGPGQAVCYATWYKVGLFNTAATPGTAMLTFQVAIHEATGAIEYRYGAMPRFTATSASSNAVNPVIVGWSRGQIGPNWSVDPKTRDLSLELPFRTFPEGSSGNMGLSATAQVAGGPIYGARMFPGQAMSWNVSDVPANALVGVQLIDVAYSRPGFALPTITAPGCVLSTSANALLWEVDVLPGPSVTGSVLFAIPPGFDGLDVYAQYIVLGGLFGAPDLITVSSNAIRHTVGRR